MPGYPICRLIQGEGSEYEWSYSPRWLDTSGRKFLLQSEYECTSANWPNTGQFQKVSRAEAHALRVCPRTKAPAWRWARIFLVQGNITNCLLGGECCATAVLYAQEDSKSTRSRLQEIVEDAGHIFILYPKFHCELNWIEYYWGRCKYFARKHCKYPLSGKQLEFSTCTWS